MDLTKRNRVIRKYLPELFEEMTCLGFMHQSE